VYADWLEEHGDPRGEYLRLRHKLADVTARLNALGEQFDPTWLAAMRQPCRWLTPDYDLTLRSGRALRLASLRQWGVYNGLLAGYPTAVDNRETVNHIVAEERTRTGTEPYL